MKWYKEKYVNRRDWLVEHVELLNLTAEEFQLLIIIDYFNSFSEEISQEKLCNKMNLSQKKMDNLLAVLISKKYLKIQVSKKGVHFLLDDLYETKVAHLENALNQNIHDLFESEFGRPLTQSEMEQLNQWVKNEDKELIIYALKEASAYQKLSLNYIAKVLKSWKEKGVTVEKIEKGVSFGN
ncbi:MAG: DnaD domain-containing protein [Anaerorhabdus sp.]